LSLLLILELALHLFKVGEVLLYLTEVLLEALFLRFWVELDILDNFERAAWLLNQILWG
jgi:hypothetical protein